MANIIEQTGKRADIKNRNPRVKHLNPHLRRHSIARFLKNKGIDNTEMLLKWKTGSKPYEVSDQDSANTARDNALMSVYHKARVLIDEGEIRRLRGYRKNAQLMYDKAGVMGVDANVLAMHYYQLGKAWSGS